MKASPARRRRYEPAAIACVPPAGKAPLAAAEALAYGVDGVDVLLRISAINHPCALLTWIVTSCPSRTTHETVVELHPRAGGGVGF